MTEFKRSRFFLIDVQDEEMLDVVKLLRGELVISRVPRIVAISLLTDAIHALSPIEVKLLAEVPAHKWTPGSELTADTGATAEILNELAGKGLLVSSAEDPTLERLRQREEAFANCQWHPYAAFYHAMIKHPTGIPKLDMPLVDLGELTTRSPKKFAKHVARYGKPPAPFHEVQGDGTSIELPRLERRGGLYETLEKRQTTRAFDRHQPMRTEDIATLLYYVFGCHGYARMSEDVTILRRTSPSGGSLHPAEAYPLILNAEGLACGLYHYNSHRHALTRISAMERHQAGELANRLACGQTWGGEAHVLFLVSLRFERNFWKYRESVKTHSVMLLDSGHLSQTFYLVCADLGLGSFLIALDSWLADETLGLDGIKEGTVALLGCGPPASKGPGHKHDFLPYTPGDTNVDGIPWE